MTGLFPKNALLLRHHVYTESGNRKPLDITITGVWMIQVYAHGLQKSIFFSYLIWAYLIIGIRTSRLWHYNYIIKISLTN